MLTFSLKQDRYYHLYARDQTLGCLMYFSFEKSAPMYRINENSKVNFKIRLGVTDLPSFIKPFWSSVYPK